MAPTEWEPQEEEEEHDHHTEQLTGVTHVCV
jgi:hypothetical protein